jgi:fucose permease
MEKNISKKIFINTSCFYGAMVFGMALVMASPILIEISQRIDRNIENMGSIFSLFYGGFIIGSFLSSSIINYWGRKKILSFFYFLLFISVLGMAFIFNYLFLITVFSLIGLSGGFIESQVSSIVLEINKKNEGLFVNLTQVFFGIGAFIGPLILTFIISKGIDWKYSYIILSLICLINFIYFLFINIPDTRLKKIRGSIKTFKPVTLDKGAVFFLLVFAIFFYVSAEMGLVIWFPTFLRLNKLFSSILASQVLSFFWLSFVAGRLLIGFLTKKVKILNILLVVTILSIPSILLGIYTENKFLIIFAFVLTGLLFSGIWPLIVSLGGLRYPSKRDFVVSILVMAGGVGGLFSPWLIGKVFSSLNLLFALNIIYIFLFFLIALIISLVIIDRKSLP